MLLTEDNYTCSLPKDVQEIAQKELNETNKLRKKALNDIRKWIKNQSHIRRTRLDSNFILRFLRMQKFDIKESCEILEKYLTMRGQYPAWFQNLDCRVGLIFKIYFPCKVLKLQLAILLRACSDYNIITTGPCHLRTGGGGLHLRVARQGPARQESHLLSGGGLRLLQIHCQ